MGDGATLKEIREMAMAFFARTAILTAAELGLFAGLADGPASEQEIRERLDLHPRGTRDFLDALAAIGMLERKDGRYQNTPVAARYFDPGKPSYLGTYLRLADLRWSKLTEALRTGLPQRNAAAGKTLFADPTKDIKAYQAFLAASEEYLYKATGFDIAEVFDWSSVTSIAEIGGARGNISAGLIDKFPHLEATVSDLPRVRPVFDDHIRSLGLDGRITFYPSDFFADPLPEAQVLIIGHVLHWWSDAERRTLLKKAYEAALPGGTVLIYDHMIDDDRSQLPGLLASMNILLASPGGSEYTPAECLGWLAEAGFEDTRQKPLGELHTLVTGRKAH